MKSNCNKLYCVHGISTRKKLATSESVKKISFLHFNTLWPLCLGLYCSVSLGSRKSVCCTANAKEEEGNKCEQSSQNIPNAVISVPTARSVNEKNIRQDSSA